MNVYALGASRNIGYHASLRLLAKGARVTFLLRSTTTLESDIAIRPYVESGHAVLVKGDAMNAEDVAKGWSVAQDEGSRPVDLVLFTIGGTPSFRLTQGFVLDPPNLDTKSLFNVITTYPPSSSHPPPKLITLSSIGLTPASHAKLPFLLRFLYGLFLTSPHNDKYGSEIIAAKARGKTWPSSEPAPAKGIMPEGWETAMEGTGTIWNDVVVLKPAFLTSGLCAGDNTEVGKLPYRVWEKEIGDGYTMSRRDVAHFIVEVLLADWEKFVGKSWHMAY